jgi:hypothetical protein
MRGIGDSAPSNREIDHARNRSASWASKRAGSTAFELRKAQECPLRMSERYPPAAIDRASRIRRRVRDFRESEPCLVSRSRNSAPNSSSVMVVMLAPSVSADERKVAAQYREHVPVGYAEWQTERVCHVAICRVGPANPLCRSARDLPGAKDRLRQELEQAKGHRRSSGTCWHPTYLRKGVNYAQGVRAHLAHNHGLFS